MPTLPTAVHHPYKQAVYAHCFDVSDLLRRYYLKDCSTVWTLRRPNVNLPVTCHKSRLVKECISSEQPYQNYACLDEDNMICDTPLILLSASQVRRQ